ncbi:BnaC05g32640D [Brassica napus]|uniref:BnaC05g32640D protein n=1 Tax=Brassica napus TaxID=3708 RepID=A0A078GDJ8_BRANA|nr:BnaC05g32640D [Brassica napus]
MAIKPNGKSPVTSDHDEKIMLFRDVTPGPHETQLRFRLIHFWEAWNPLKKTLIGLEMLLIDEQGSVIQGFIPPSRIEGHLPKMKPGSLYKLNNFYGSSNKTVYRVSDHAVTVSFSWNSELSVLEDSPTPFDEDRFRFHSFEDFQASCDHKGDLYDVVGHMKLVNGQHVLVHVQSYDGPVMKLYLWDQAARDFCKKFKSYEGTPTVLLVTTVNTKSLGGTLALTSMSSSRVFMDCDVQPTVDYFSWLGSNPQSAELVNAEVVTKRETLTIGEIFSYIKDGSNKEAFFECTATIDDVVHGSTWYYISCSGCHTKATKGPTSLMCSKCGKVNISGVPQYRAQISVYDNSEQAVFVLLGDAGFELTGKQAAELVSSYFEANGDQGVTQEVPFPEALISTIGQKHNFCVKVTKHNLDGKSRSLTVTKILPLDTSPVTESSGGNYNPATSEETFETGANVCGASKTSVDPAEGSKRNGDIGEMGKAKRLKRGV